MKITLDYTNVMGIIKESEIQGAMDKYRKARETAISKTGKGSDFLGWVNLPEEIGGKLVDDIVDCAEKIRKDTDIFVVIGIGGSYLGARAAIDALLPYNYNQLVKPQVYFAGNSISPNALTDLLKIMEGKRVSVNVISKSGTTTEPALAFRLIWNWMVKNYGRKEAARRTIATTDKSKGALRQFADAEGMKTYVIPDDVGGRFSVLTPVGLLPIAVAGIDVKAMIAGAAEGIEEFRDEEDLNSNPASMYAVLRNILYEKGKRTEILANFEPQLHYISEWWKQLFGESEGKGHNGIFPASCDFSTDLHSMGQWIQDGRREIFETFLDVEALGSNLAVEKDEKNLDKLNYLDGKTLEYINRQALLGTRQAHLDGGAPNMTITIPHLAPFCIGKLFYFFEWAVAVSGYMLGVNPFDQPGVESYKKNMFALLDQPGYEQQSKAIREQLSGAKQFRSQRDWKLEVRR